MSREQAYQSIILKKQPYGEGDELITVFTRENGKTRVMAKSVKYSKSKLAYSLQALFLVELRVTNSKLPKVIGAEVVNSFKIIRQYGELITAALYAVELMLKFTPDEQPNEALFNVLANFFSYLETTRGDAARTALGIAKFKIAFLETVGFGINAPVGLLELPEVGFSQSRGGFLAEEAVDYEPVSAETLREFIELSACPFENLNEYVTENIAELQSLLSRFVRYQLERDIKSERYLGL